MWLQSLLQSLHLPQAQQVARRVAQPVVLQVARQVVARQVARRVAPLGVAWHPCFLVHSASPSVTGSQLKRAQCKKAWQGQWVGLVGKHQSHRHYGHHTQSLNLAIDASRLRTPWPVQNGPT